MTLKTETNTPRMEARILSAFEASPDYTSASAAHEEPQHRARADFDGQWWITCLDCGGQWAVEDAEGGDSIDGFTFEQVTRGEED